MSKLILSSARKVIIFSVSAVLLMGMGYFAGYRGYSVKVNEAKQLVPVRDLPPDKSTMDFSLFWQVWDELHESYYDQGKIDNSQLVYGAVSGMVEAVGDPYTVFLPPSENKVVQEDLSGSFEGVGIQIGYKGTALAVIAPLPKSPAEEAGGEAGDLILGIKDDGKGIDIGTVGISLPEAVKAIRGPQGSKVSLVLARELQAEPLVVDIVRKSIDVPSVIFEEKEEAGKKVAWVQLLKFGAETELEWNSAVLKIKNGSYSGVILDLRNNPGGYLDGAVDVASDFISSGVVVVEEGSKSAHRDYRVSHAAALADIPLVVVVNGGSASASEIVSGALKDSGRAKIVGTVTFGKGTIQEPMEFGQGAGLHVTIAKWLTPNGTWVHDTGLEPDVVVKNDPDTAEDEQLQESLKVLSS